MTTQLIKITRSNCNIYFHPSEILTIVPVFRQGEVEFYLLKIRSLRERVKISVAQLRLLDLLINSVDLIDIELEVKPAQDEFDVYLDNLVNEFGVYLDNPIEAEAALC
jgi:hypothetical protein